MRLWAVNWVNDSSTSSASLQDHSRFALTKGIIIVTKFEFGMIGDELILIDEVLTPDSSRFWPTAVIHRKFTTLF